LRPALTDIFGDQPRPLPAGRQFHYSNPGFALLGALAGRLRGHSWDEAVRREILTPLGMTRTTLRAQAPHAGGFAVHPWADTMQPEPAEHTGHMAPAGDLWSTADDLCRLAAFLPNGDDRVLPAATLEEMRAPAAPPTGGAGYGLGIQVAGRAERTLFGHGGSMPGFLATLWVSPDDGLGAVTLANATAGPATGEIAADLIDIVASHEPRLPERWRPQPDIGADLLALTGLWYWGPRATVLRVVSRDMIELAPVAGPGRASRFRAAADGTWAGLDGYYAGETLRAIPRRPACPVRGEPRWCGAAVRCGGAVPRRRSATTWKFRIRRKESTHISCFISAGCKVSTLTAARLRWPGPLPARGPLRHHVSLKLRALPPRGPKHPARCRRAAVRAPC
jgi:hypothetical protein